MAAAHLTFEEAAVKLGLSPEEFKRRLKTDPRFKELDRAKIRDGTSFRFKAPVIDELARELGAVSEPELPLSPLVSPPEADSDDFKVSTTIAKPPKKADEEPILFSASDDDNIFSLAPDDATPPTKKPAKSDSDSDVRLDGGKPKKSKPGKGKDDEAVIPTEEISIDFSPSNSAVIKGGSSAKLSAPKSSGKLTSDSGKGLPKPVTGDSSEFELSLDADSDDFELKLNTDASDDAVDLGEMPKDSGGSGRRGGESGILSRKPNDSGLSLEKGKSKDKVPPPVDDGDSDVDFELTLDSSAAVSGTKLGGPKGRKPLSADSDSEFELTLDDSSGSFEAASLGTAEDEASKGDIFETDFEIPPMDESGSEAVALDASDTDLEKSDFDVALDDSDVESDSSGSEVVLLEDDEDAPVPMPRTVPSKKAKKKTAPVDEEGDVDLAEVEESPEEEDSAAGALKGVRGKHHDEEDDEDDEALPAGAAAYRPVPWGIVPTLFLLPAFVIVLLGGLVAFELLQTMWGYQQPRKPAAPLVRELAKALDMELKDQ